MPKSGRQCIICRKTAAISRRFYMKIESDIVAAKIRIACRRNNVENIKDSMIGEFVHRNCYKSLVRKMPSVKRPWKGEGDQQSFSEQNENSFIVDDENDSSDIYGVDMPVLKSNASIYPLSNRTNCPQQLTCETKYLKCKTNRTDEPSQPIFSTAPLLAMKMDSPRTSHEFDCEHIDDSHCSADDDIALRPTPPLAVNVETAKAATRMEVYEEPMNDVQSHAREIDEVEVLSKANQVCAPSLTKPNTLYVTSPTNLASQNSSFVHQSVASIAFDYRSFSPSKDDVSQASSDHHARTNEGHQWFNNDSDDNSSSSLSEDDCMTIANEQTSTTFQCTNNGQRRSNRMSTPKTPKTSRNSQISFRSTDHSRSFSRNASEPCLHTRLPSSLNRLPVPADDTESHVYENGFDELCEWLVNELETGIMLAMTDIQHQYISILRRRNEPVCEGSTRSTAIRARLETRFKEDLLFEKLNNASGTHVVLNDLSTYVRSSISSQNSNPGDGSKLSGSDNSPIDDCTVLFNAIKLIRRTISSGSHYLKHLASNRHKLTSLTTGSLWESAPLLLKNFIGLLTMSSRQFSDVERDGTFLEMLENDMFEKSQKWLKIASISFDIMNCQNEGHITPKHYLLANEIFRQTRSADLLTILNRMGHSCSYKTVARLHHEAAERSKSSFALAPNDRGPPHTHPFLIKVADNFDLNRDSVHGENSIHILNQIFVTTPENDEISTIVADLLDDICEKTVKRLNEIIGGDAHVEPDTIKMTPVLTSRTFVNSSFNVKLLAYGLVKFIFEPGGFSSRVQLNRPITHVPLLSGFFASFLSFVKRPLHSIQFLVPINDDPSSMHAAEACMKATSVAVLETKHQKEAVIVVDEKIFRNLSKVKRNNPSHYDKTFIYPGDFHFAKNTMILIWDILDGSGIDSVLEQLYRGATLRAILNVHHFNHSLRACKLLFTALSIMLLDAFFESAMNPPQMQPTTTTLPTGPSGTLVDLLPILREMPSEFAKGVRKQEWFAKLLDVLNESNLQSSIDAWADDQCRKSASFRLWLFVFRHLLQPLMIFYSSIRCNDFDLRNSTVTMIAPLFFATNHRNYARLCAQHLFQLQKCTPYLYERLRNGFSVVRSNRHFADIGLDQAIECSINRFGKSQGGISGHFSDIAIDIWCNSFGYRADLSRALHEICGMSSNADTLDAHLECSPNQQAIDNEDLSIIVAKLRKEQIFDASVHQCRKLSSGRVIHDEIVDDTCDLFRRGQLELNRFTENRLIRNFEGVDDTMKKMPRLKLSDAETFVPSSSNNLSSKPRKSSNTSKPFDIKNMRKRADDAIRRTVVIAEQRSLSITDLFKHEFSPAPLSLCNQKDMRLLNQGHKASAITFLKEKFPAAFSSTCPSKTTDMALVIDGGSLLETRPQSRNCTVNQYAIQLLEAKILRLFDVYSRVDIVFDSSSSKEVKQFIERHTNDGKHSDYDLKEDDILDASFHKFVHSNRAELARVLRKCWLKQSNRLPNGKVLTIAGPDKSAEKMEQGYASVDDYILECNHVEADTRMLLHANVLLVDGYPHVVIQTIDTDVILLAVAKGASIGLSSLFIHSFNPAAKTNTYINCLQIVQDLQMTYSGMDPFELLPLHALSGCDSTSFVRNVTKVKFFSTYFDNYPLFSDIRFLLDDDLFSTAHTAAQRLLIACFAAKHSTEDEQSLDHLRGTMATVAFKRQAQEIALNLPPTASAFRLHCDRAAVQVNVWANCFEQYIKPCDLLTSGYTIVDNQLSIQWSNLESMPHNDGLVTCGRCKDSCQRCKCAKNNFPCTVFCQCKCNTKQIRVPVDHTAINRNPSLSTAANSMDDDDGSNTDSSDSSSSDDNEDKDKYIRACLNLSDDSDV